jgi:small-conductance mechanosensitive channel
MSGDDIGSTSLTEALTAVGTLLLVVVAVFLVDRAFKRRGITLARRVAGGDLDPVLETRLRFVRRLVEALIILVGIATALSQFTALDRVATSVLASTAFIVAVVGFAAQQTLANVIAGVMLAITQPIRIGDRVAFEEHRGVVEDIRLTHTFLQTGGDTRVIVPNGKLAQVVVRNESIVTETVATEVELWLAHESDELRALDVLAGAPEVTGASIKEVTFEGTILTVAGTHVTPVERPGREADLRRDCLRALRDAGLR